MTQGTSRSLTTRSPIRVLCSQSVFLIWLGTLTVGPVMFYGKIAILPYVDLLYPPTATSLEVWQEQMCAWRIKAWALLAVTAAVWWVWWRLSPRPVFTLMLWVAGPKLPTDANEALDESQN